MSLCPPIFLQGNALLASHTLAKLHHDCCLDALKHLSEAVATLSQNLENERSRLQLAEKEVKQGVKRLEQGKIELLRARNLLKQVEKRVAIITIDENDDDDEEGKDVHGGGSDNDVGDNNGCDSNGGVDDEFPWRRCVRTRQRIREEDAVGNQTITFERGQEGTNYSFSTRSLAIPVAASRHANSDVDRSVIMTRSRPNPGIVVNNRSSFESEDLDAYFHEGIADPFQSTDSNGRRRIEDDEEHQIEMAQPQSPTVDLHYNPPLAPEWPPSPSSDYPWPDPKVAEGPRERHSPMARARRTTLGPPSKSNEGWSAKGFHGCQDVDHISQHESFPEPTPRLSIPSSPSAGILRPSRKRVAPIIEGSWSVS
eukprot:CAMPEP_0194341374 /NCGR_PEP_ID=MMETSP0171-20130528/89511_1 /TAXON_ID=218684 /ORGANISM="Corethron pennatum, Strain L29A3" /LENGTH=367 /DNA_ID=CAMNT_0039106695 /DNA_START=151 /DNA_END=1254 /DNA_ORIENTATION=+